MGSNKRCYLLSFFFTWTWMLIFQNQTASVLTCKTTDCSFKSPSYTQFSLTAPSSSSSPSLLFFLLLLVSYSSFQNQIFSVYSIDKRAGLAVPVVMEGTVCLSPSFTANWKRTLKPVQSSVKISFQWGKAFSAMLCYSFKKYILQFWYNWCYIAASMPTTRSCQQP